MIGKIFKVIYGDYNLYQLLAIMFEIQFVITSGMEFSSGKHKDCAESWVGVCICAYLRWTYRNK